MSGYINAVADDEKRKDAKKLLALMKEATGEKPKLWGNSIIGFGSYAYVSKSGCEGEWPLVGFSPRKQALVVYIMPGFASYKDFLKKLGPHKISGGSCLYIKRLEDIHIPALKKMIRDSYKLMKKRYSSA